MTVPLWTGVPAPCVDVPVGVVGVVGVPGVPGVVGGGVVGGAVAVPFSMAVATISISPLSGTVFDDGNSVMTVPLGASSGTLSHEEATRMSGTAATIDAARSIPGRCRSCASIEGAKDNTLMGLAGQDIGRWERGQRGYAMAALLIALAVMAIVMSVAMPVWRHEALREKEAELVWRGEQYARAIALFRAKNSQNPNMLPPSIDELVNGRYLRKKYKDPMTKDGEFVPMQFGQQSPGMPGATNPAGRGTAPSQPSPIAVGGIAGVRSKSQETSIRSYQGADSLRSMGFSLYQRSAAGRRHADGEFAGWTGKQP